LRRFQWEGFSEFLHNFVLYDEFEFEHVTLSNWKLIAEGSYYKQDIKFINAGEVIRIQCPFVMISNFPPHYKIESVTDREAISVRIKEIQAIRSATDKGPDFELRYCKSKDTMHIPLTYDELMKTLENEINPNNSNANQVISESITVNESFIYCSHEKLSKKEYFEIIINEFETLYKLFGKFIIE
jgi:hypothetical protein